MNNIIDTKVLNNVTLSKVKDLNYTVSDSAPSTLGDLKAISLTVWSGASDKTIYNDPKVNYAFRAYHDHLHRKLRAPFTLQGELLVAKAQCLELNSDTLSAFIIAEVYGQTEYFYKHGEFPVNQVDFINTYLKGGNNAKI